MLEVPKHITEICRVHHEHVPLNVLSSVAIMFYLAGLIVRLIDEYLENRSVSSTNSPKSIMQSVSLRSTTLP